MNSRTYPRSRSRRTPPRRGASCCSSRRARGNLPLADARDGASATRAHLPRLDGESRRPHRGGPLRAPTGYFTRSSFEIDELRWQNRPLGAWAPALCLAGNLPEGSPWPRSRTRRCTARSTAGAGCPILALDAQDTGTRTLTVYELRADGSPRPRRRARRPGWSPQSPLQASAEDLHMRARGGRHAPRGRAGLPARRSRSSIVPALLQARRASGAAHGAAFHAPGRRLRRAPRAAVTKNLRFDGDARSSCAGTSAPRPVTTSRPRPSCCGRRSGCRRRCSS